MEVGGRWPSTVLALDGPKEPRRTILCGGGQGGHADPPWPLSVDLNGLLKMPMNQLSNIYPLSLIITLLGTTNVFYQNLDFLPNIMYKVEVYIITNNFLFASYAY